MRTLTIACPVDLIAAGNALALAINSEPGSAQTFVAPPEGAGGTAADGTAVALASAPMSEARIEAALTVAAGAEGLDAWIGEGDVPQARAGRIVAVLGLPALEAVAAMGVTRA